jgi:16S rRNA (uracil1498-N3)-methyltransferase
MATHSIYLETPLYTGELAITGEEAQHAARVKRVTPGDTVRVLDGHGHFAAAAVLRTGKSSRGEWQIVVRVDHVQEAPRTAPRLEVLTAAPKGARLSDLIDGLSQVGAASWSLLRTRRAEVDPRPGKLERLDRTALEACKQCGRAWRLEIGEDVAFADAVRASGTILADSSGGPYARTGSPVVRLLIGPEGGWAPEELVAARSAGIRIARFGPHVMRIETAAVVAAGVILDAEARNGPQ